MKYIDVLAKILCGRFCLALMAGIVFIIATYQGALESKDIIIILTVVFHSYFNGGTNGNSKGGLM